jgi:hypothetical protein
MFLLTQPHLITTLEAVVGQVHHTAPANPFLGLYRGYLLIRYTTTQLQPFPKPQLHVQSTMTSLTSLRTQFNDPSTCDVPYRPVLAAAI